MATPKPQNQRSVTLPKSYEPEGFEQELYSYWKENGCFDSADESVPGQKPFCIVIPPPNVTGVLHMGHALTNTIQDILTRWRRMCGDNTLWLPGTDHAGIATQAQVEKQIAKEGKGPTGRPLTRHDLGREKFLERTWAWKEEHATHIQNQLRRLGSSLDWKRERFTMDDGFSTAVKEVFVRLYEENLIYRGERIINWCCRCQTALSDLEVIPTDRKGFLWHINYSVVNDDGTPVINPETKAPATITIATTRPETLLGDTAVAVHPADERFSAYHGKKAKLPILGRLIPIITDEYVAMDFGTGGLKVTPAHDFNDYELGKKHDLPIVQVMGKDGKIGAAGGPYAGMKFSEAREGILQRLKEAGELVKTEDHQNKVGLCQRCDSVAEPMMSKQWFVKIQPLADPAIKAVRDGKIKFLPQMHEKIYYEWMENIRDWCISRQLWWGHQIPAWYCGECQNITVSRTIPEKCSSCGTGAAALTQDEDVLDTWFSSGLWPFGTLGWPEKTSALKTFYPTSILETGSDILFFWVARMIMMGIHFMGEVPFHKVYLHAMVRDEKGEKMSKSKGNVIDPLELIGQHGADPLRFTLAAMAGQGRDIKLNADRVEGYRAFCNKIWNAVKFFHLQFEEAQGGPIAEPAEGAEAWLMANSAKLMPANAWILSRLQELPGRVNPGLENFELNECAQAIYEFAWHELCDWYIEFAKAPLRAGGAGRTETLLTLHYVLEKMLTTAHPFIPFVTEELWLSLPWRRAANTPTRKRDGKPEIETLMFQAWPTVTTKFKNEKAETQINAIRLLVEAIRNFRGENNISPKIEFAVKVVATRPGASVKSYESDVKALARVTKFEEATGAAGAFETSISVPSLGVDLRISLQGLVNVEEESKRVKKEMEKVRADVEFVSAKLGKESFISKAPPELVAKEKAKLTEYEQKLKELEQSLERLSKLG